MRNTVSRRSALKIAGATALGALAVGALPGCAPSASQTGTDNEGQDDGSNAYEGMDVEQMDAYAVVVGAGASGLLAAYTLAKAGKNPVVIDKGASSMGSNFSMLSGPAAVDDAWHAQAGVTITTALNVYDHMTTYAKGSVNTKLIRNLLAESPEAIQDMMDAGLTFYTYMEYTGDDRYADDITWAPVLNITQEGEDRIAPMVSAIEAMGAQFIYNCEGTEVMVEDGKVCGVRAVRDRNTLLEIKTPAVFLGTGGYGASEEMVKEMFDGVPLVNMGTPNNSGDGIRMAMAAGAVKEPFVGIVSNEICGSNVKHGSAMYDENWNLNNENLAFAIYGGLVVDGTGERFMNEEGMAFDPLVYSGQAGMAVGKYYVLVDGEYYENCTTQGVYSYLGSPEEWNFGREMFYPVLSSAPSQFDAAVSEGWAVKGDTIAEVAAAFGLTNLEQTVANYNEMCAAGVDTEFGKNPIFLTPIKEGKGYYLFEYNAAFWCTLGGIRTNANLVALDGNNEEIPGLYIGGVNMGSAFCRPYYDIKGSACGLSVASGVLGGKNMIAYIEG